ncbi:MAG: hypothetical protein JW986_04925 [Methanotrichaceae archaeon]|nr:hypothetical protein [Methanotrichaceae archaeon]
MIHKGKRTKGGSMPTELQEKVDQLLEEFVLEVDRISEERHLQKGIARASLPCSLVIVMDGENVFVLSQLRAENLSSTYIYAPETHLLHDKALSSARWEFGFDDPFVLQFERGLLDQECDDRRADLAAKATSFVDSEFTRFMWLLSFLKTKPAFGLPPFAMDADLAYLLIPAEKEDLLKAAEAALQVNKLIPKRSGEILDSERSIKEMWRSLVRARVVVADVGGLRPDVIYALGVAHTLGKETVLLRPEEGSTAAELPHTAEIAYRADKEGLLKLEGDLASALKGIVESLSS